ncbi:extensin family protein [Rhodoblastus sp.]|uniref:extensin-like domain-containing protein n=1 Tax=Rhodoblastus sp. TaxID=1962975 RepID=UPI0035B43D27
MRPSARLLVCSLFVSTQLWPAAASVAPPLPPPRPADLVVAPPSVEPPQPPPRPPDLTQPAPPATPAPPPEPSPAAVENPEDPAACDQLLSSGAVTVKRLPPIGGENGCGIAAPVSLEAVILSDKRVVKLEPPLTLRCDFAAAAARWIATDLVPSIEASAKASFGRVARFAGAGGYQCRPRNGQAGAFLSEHARGNAMDIDAIVFEDGRTLSLSNPANDLELATDLRASACDAFSTVLGPGADAAHDHHIHLDLERRRHGGRICEWDLQ